MLMGVVGSNVFFYDGLQIAVKGLSPVTPKVNCGEKIFFYCFIKFLCPNIVVFEGEFFFLIFNG